VFLDTPKKEAVLFGSHKMLQTTLPLEMDFVILPYRAAVRLSIKLGTDSCETIGYGMSARQGLQFLSIVN